MKKYLLLIVILVCVSFSTGCGLTGVTIGGDPNYRRNRSFTVHDLSTGELHHCHSYSSGNVTCN